MIGVRRSADDDPRCIACFGASDVVVYMVARNGNARQTFSLCSSCSSDLREHLVAFDDVRTKA